jgi:hypothetical protein
VATAVTANTTINLSSTPNGVAFSSNASCAGASINSVQLVAGTSGAVVYFRSNTPGTYTLDATSSPLLPATQQANVVLAPNDLAFITTPPPAPLLAGRCFIATVQAQRGAAPVPVAGDTTIGLTVSPTAASNFYSDANCATAITTATMLAGQSTATFYVKPLTGVVSQVITATAPFGADTQNYSAISAVRRGNFSMTGQTTLSDGGIVNGQTVDTSTFSPAQQDAGATLLIFQATTSNSSPSNNQVRCRLNTLSQVRCERNNDISSVDIHWQTLELPTGLSVQRFSSTSCPPLSQTLTLARAVNPGSTFVLSSIETNSSSYDDEEMTVAFLTGPTTVEVASGAVGATGTCSGYEIEVAELSGLSVDRGGLDAGLGAQQYSTTFTGLPATSANTAVLSGARPRDSDPATEHVCSLLVRSDNPTPTSLTFSRSGGIDAGFCGDSVLSSLPWQRLDFGARARVQRFVRTVTGTSLTVTIAPVDTTRTLVFASGQQGSGAGTGETNYNGGLGSRVGIGSARFVLTNSTTVTITRGDGSGDGIFTFYVVEIDP